MSVLINAKIDALLESTSRSFYPTLKYLPKKIRGQIGLLYLLARAADTIADSKHGETEVLLKMLREYNEVAQGRSNTLPDFTEIAEIQTNEDEAELLRNVQDVVDGLEVYDKGDQERMLECLDIIVGGQILDLERFGPAKEGGNISALSTEEERDDYTYRVAGCVGVFWTKMSLAHIISIPEEKRDEFFEKGIRFGKAPQMINILRDIPEDLRFGRCYIPIEGLDRYELKPEDLMDHNNIDTFRLAIRRISRYHRRSSGCCCRIYQDDSRQAISSQSCMYVTGTNRSTNCYFIAFRKCAKFRGENQGFKR